MAHIETLIQLQCCNRTVDLDPIVKDIDPSTTPGCELIKTICHTCGSEYMFGVITRTQEQSLADEAFEHVSDEVLDEIGVDKTDFEAPEGEVRMCARCDGTAAAADLCSGCGEYIHEKCESRIPQGTRAHAAEEHWEEPKTQLAMASVATVDDDGSKLTGDDALVDDFVAEG